MIEAVFLTIVLCGVFASYRVRIEPRTAQAMTKTQMQSVATGLTNAGFPAELILMPDASWQVRSRSSDFNVLASTVCSFATAQGVIAEVAEVRYR
jgi:hypothetical protein